MSYRCKKEESASQRHYKEFCHNNRDLTEQIGIPSFIMDDPKHFTYLLMHGDLWPNAPIHFDVFNLDVKRYELWKLLVDKYFEAGFSDPGLGCLTGAEIETLAKKIHSSLYLIFEK